MSLVPKIEAKDWEDVQGFRETLLHHITGPRANEAARAFGKWVYTWVLEATWDRAEPGRAQAFSTTRLELQAALVDLRALQGFLAQVGNEREESALSPGDERLSRLGADLAQAIGELGDQLERQLGRKRRSRAGPAGGS
jgi:hypothetical protein